MKFKGILALSVALMLFAGSAAALMKGSKEFAGGPMGKVTFDATKHAAKGIKCAECHQTPKLFSQEKGGSKEKMTMAAMNKGELCGACHDGTKDNPKKSFSVKTPGDCAKCHKK
jgi:c(7)-type cytochrome triheme protein